MRSKIILIFLITTLSHHRCNAQLNLLDSCGIDSNPILNEYEIIILDSLFFSSYETKKHLTINSANRFEFRAKKIAFYSCTKNSNTKGNGLLSKREFFSLCRPNFKGHAGRGIVVFNETEKINSKGFDAVIIIDCPYDHLSKRSLIMQLTNKSD